MIETLPLPSSPLHPPLRVFPSPSPERAVKLSPSAEHKMKHGYSVLAEVDIFLQALQRGEINQESKEYVLENELTAACEAVDSGGSTWSNYRPYDKEKGSFIAFGRPFSEMLRLGVSDMRSKAQTSPEYGFEVRRREAELENEEAITRDYQRGLLKNKVLLTVSPFPEEAGDEKAESVGYKSKERLGKLRFEALDLPFFTQYYLF